MCRLWWRQQVAGQYFTLRKPAVMSYNDANRAAANLLSSIMAMNTSAEYAQIKKEVFILSQAAESPNSRGLVSYSRVYRSFGSPRTSSTRLMGCASSATAPAPFVELGSGAQYAGPSLEVASVDPDDGCGLEWTLMILVNWISFFEDSYRERDLSLLVFIIWLLLQAIFCEIVIQGGA